MRGAAFSLPPARLLPQARGQLNHRYDHQTKREELPRPGVTKITKDMEKLGLVEKKAAKTDGRVVFIKITASGKDLVDKYVDQYFGELSAELDDISDADADNMIETIEKLYEVMKGRK